VPLNISTGFQPLCHIKRRIHSVASILPAQSSV
jgi:hypothetical protein